MFTLWKEVKTVPRATNGHSEQRYLLKLQIATPGVQNKITCSKEPVNGLLKCPLQHNITVGLHLLAIYCSAIASHG